jgi:hypothetical protein
LCSARTSQVELPVNVSSLTKVALEVEGAGEAGAGLKRLASQSYCSIFFNVYRMSTEISDGTRVFPANR